MKSKVFLKFVISYIAVLIIPIVLVTLFFNLRFINVLSDEVMNSTCTSLSQVKDIMNDNIRYINNLSSQINSNKKICNLFYDYNIEKKGIYPEVPDAIKELREYTINSIVDDIILFFNNSDVIISNESKYDLHAFFMRYNIWQENDINEFKDIYISKTKTFQTMDGDNKYPYVIRNISGKIVYVRPMPIDVINPVSNLLITVDNKVFENSVEKVLGGYSGTVYMLNHDDEVVYETNLGNKPINPEIKNKFLNHIQGYEKYVYTEKIDKHMVIYVKSKHTDWKYMAVMPVNQILQKVVYVRNLGVKIIICSLIIGLVVAFCFSSGNYTKVKKIINSISPSRNIILTHKNEWDYIYDSIDKFIKENKSLRSRITDHMPILRKNFFTRLLKGQLKNVNQIESSMRLLDITIKKGFIAILIIDIESHNKNRFMGLDLSSQDILRITIMNTVESFFNKIGYCYAVDIDTNRVAVILRVDSMDNSMNKQIYGIAENVRLYTKENYELGVTIGVSTFHNSLYDASKVFNEAITAIDYKIVKGEDTVIDFSEIKSYKDEMCYYNFDQEKLIINSLKIGDFSTIKNTLNYVISDIRNNPVSLDIVKCTCFEIINTAMKSINELGINNFDSGYSLPSLANFKTIDEIQIEILAFYEDLCDKLEKAKQYNKSELIKKVNDYLMKNYFDNNLSQDIIASKFSISVSYLSRLFKDQMGLNFLDYLQNLRLEKAKELLLKSDESIATVALKVGYNSFRTFSRVFKRYEKITPTEYRTSEKIKENFSHSETN